MAKIASEEDLILLRCDKIVNETWSKAAVYYEEIKFIMEKGGPSNEAEEAIMMIAANATLQKMTLDKAKDELLFELS
jgi:hypothetical protein